MRSRLRDLVNERRGNVRDRADYEIAVPPQGYGRRHVDVQRGKQSVRQGHHGSGYPESVVKGTIAASGLPRWRNDSRQSVAAQGVVP
jgi:hypothetical protein